MFNDLIHLDQQLLLKLNGSESLYLDNLMQIVTSTFTWVPVGVVLLYVLFKNNSFKHFFILLGMFALLIIIADGVSSGIVKPLVARPRPTQDPQLMYIVQTVNGYRGGRFGFFSSHAANTFAVFTFFALLVRHWGFSFILLSWTLLNCYSRMYLGVHYPLDITVGIIWGAIVGVIVYLLYVYIDSKIVDIPRKYISTQYTNSGYMTEDVYLLIASLAATYMVVAIVAAL